MFGAGIPISFVKWCFMTQKQISIGRATAVASGFLYRGGNDSVGTAVAADRLRNRATADDDGRWKALFSQSVASVTRAQTAW